VIPNALEEPRTEAAGQFYLLGLNDRVVGIPELPEQWTTYLILIFILLFLVRWEHAG